jgi:hypothetical protein
MPIKPIGFAILFVLASCYCARAQSIIIQKGINLPHDTAAREQLISALNGFMAQKEKPNKENTYVLKADLPETSALLDEIKGMEQNYALKDNNFYKCYLTNVIDLDEHNYIVQFSYLGINDGMPLLHASFKLLAKKQDGQFYFDSPLKQNTAGWKVKKYKGITCYYADSLNSAGSVAKAYLQKVSFYDRKLNIAPQPIEFYYCNNFTEAQQILGIDYKADYNGSKTDGLSSNENGSTLIIAGWGPDLIRLFSHDLFHSRLAVVMKTNVNRPVNEGCAYLYGGSWGYTWEDVMVKFKKYAAENHNADWLNLYINSIKLEDDDKPIYIAYVLNALIVQKIESEKGFGPVMELLGCGPREKGDENYCKALDKLTGITKADFNAEMWKLIKAEK